MRVQRTLSSASARRSPLTRHRSGRVGSTIFALIESLLVGALILGSGSAWASPTAEVPSEPFVLDSTSSTYPFVFRVEGTLKRLGDTIEVSVKSGEIRSAIPSDLGDEGKATVVLVSFGVGHAPEGGWQMVNHSQPEP